MHDEDVIARIDPDADDVAEDPVVGQGLRPHRIDLEPRRLHHLPLHRSLERGLADAQRRNAEDQARGDEELATAGHRVPSPRGTPWFFVVTWPNPRNRNFCTRLPS